MAWWDAHSTFRPPTWIAPRPPDPPPGALQMPSMPTTLMAAGPLVTSKGVFWRPPRIEPRPKIDPMWSLLPLPALGPEVNSQGVLRSPISVYQRPPFLLPKPKIEPFPVGSVAPVIDPALLAAGVLASPPSVYQRPPRIEPHPKIELTEPFRVPPGPAQSGVWYNISPGVLSWDPNNPANNYGAIGIACDWVNGYIYVGTNYQGLWYSTDFGVTWTKRNTGTGGSLLDAGRLWSLEIAPWNHQELWTTPGYGGNGALRSTDGGVTWTDVFSSSTLASTIGTNDVYRIALDPYTPGHVLLSFHSSWTNAVSPNSGLAESFDYGATWTERDPPGGSSWGNGTVVAFLGNTNRWIVGTQTGGIWLTNNAGSSWTQIMGTSNINHGAIGFVSQEPVTGAYLAAANTSLFRSTDGGATWSDITDSVDFAGHNAIASDGVNLWTGDINGAGYNPAVPPFTNWWSTPINSISWTASSQAPTQGMLTSGPQMVAYDLTNGYVYTCNWGGGVWRLNMAALPPTVAQLNGPLVSPASVYQRAAAPMPKPQPPVSPSLFAPPGPVIDASQLSTLSTAVAAYLRAPAQLPKPWIDMRPDFVSIPAVDPSLQGPALASPKSVYQRPPYLMPKPWLDLQQTFENIPAVDPALLSLGPLTPLISVFQRPARVEPRPKLDPFWTLLPLPTLDPALASLGALLNPASVYQRPPFLLPKPWLSLAEAIYTPPVIPPMDPALQSLGVLANPFSVYLRPPRIEPRPLIGVTPNIETIPAMDPELQSLGPLGPLVSIYQRPAYLMPRPWIDLNPTLDTVPAVDPALQALGPPAAPFSVYQRTAPLRISEWLSLSASLISVVVPPMDPALQALGALQVPLSTYRRPPFLLPKRPIEPMPTTFPLPSMDVALQSLGPLVSPIGTYWRPPFLLPKPWLNLDAQYIGFAAALPLPIHAAVLDVPTLHGKASDVPFIHGDTEDLPS